ncbi:MAG TPA: Sir2 family NAD-dependent protein deacetylase [Abditibacteriaceae bacterium]
MPINAAITQAAQAIAQADALLITAGAGMGVDSGLPDFRGNEGFWKAYPPLQKLGISFAEMANPRWFKDDPHLAWGFYGHRLRLYRDTTPHHGFNILLGWGRQAPAGYRVLTSNVDGQFQRAGFEPARVLEVHGSIHHLQCSRPCSQEIWSAEGIEVQVDAESFRARSPLPQCPGCGAIARPNILMFGDGSWIGTRTEQQETQLQDWLCDVGHGKLVVIECGAGKAIPTVRRAGETLQNHFRAQLVRINKRDADGPAGTISIGDDEHENTTPGALDALRLIENALRDLT